MKTKRVAMVLFSYYLGDPRPRRAGEALAQEGLSVDVICLRENGDAKHESVNGVQIRRVPIQRRRGGIAGYFYQYLAFLVVSSVIILRRSLSQRYDLVYVHNMPDFLVLSGFVPRLFGAKVILDLHDPMPELMQTIFDLPPKAKSVRLLRWVEKRSMALADAVVTVNQACAKIFAARSCPAEKITVVMNSPDETIFDGKAAVAEDRPQSPPKLGGESSEARRGGSPSTPPQSFPVGTPSLQASPDSYDRPFVVMYHGSLVERNGLGLAVDAFARVRRAIPSAELHIYGGRNAFLDEVMQSVKTQGLETVVHYKGRKALEEIVEAIKICDVGIIPNLRNIFTELNTPTRIFEYLAMGKPVIAPRSPGITDYFDENALVFFELGNAGDLARQIEFVFQCPARAKEITRRGQQIHLAHTWRAEKSRLTELVARLLNDSSVAGGRTSRQSA